MNDANEEGEKNVTGLGSQLKNPSAIKIEEYFQAFGDETQEALHCPSAESDDDRKLKDELIGRHVRK